MAANEDVAVVRVQFNDEWIVRFHVRSLRELSHTVISHYYWGTGTSSGVQPKHVRLLLPNGGELDDRAWQQYLDRLRVRKGGALKREDMLLCFAKRLDYDTVESGRDTLDSDSSVSTMQVDSQNPKRATTSSHPEID
mmetsp:Transcript_10788/g.16941  ORF Transcript_10788/g.16941 Transcript_10788/m.16941 type:complete len:137 (-) Transcript_10788:992-1402(-)|eukprot:CAMPEP_0184325270 /NCGR_PEP_ID=MMETSP1049-20130417/139569_1 /TAXON_ID=77928 /ORGANISM="Proteomonas sulcata, Strain CCMP704" /LENGTH=136 /DNA_ID=CAMNT_0026647285 /DNA_START=205 /DNA_END=615 /DNA_ORIENTATION=+